MIKIETTNANVKLKCKSKIKCKVGEGLNPLKPPVTSILLRLNYKLVPKPDIFICFFVGRGMLLMSRYYHEVKARPVFKVQFFFFLEWGGRGCNKQFAQQSEPYIITILTTVS